MHAELIYATKQDGNFSMKYDRKENVIENKKRFLKKHRIQVENAFTMKVINQNRIFELTTDFKKEHPDLSQVTIEADAAITTIPDIYIYLAFGDCIPLLLFDTQKNVMAFVHMGWQSVEHHLHRKVLSLMVEKHHCKIENIEAWMGPSIKKESYLIAHPTQRDNPLWKEFIHTKNDTYQVDLNGYLYADLKQLQVPTIHNDPRDTGKDPNFYSHHRSTVLDPTQENGRFLCGAILRN